MAEESNKFDKAIESTETFVETNSKPLIIGIVAVVLLIVGTIYYFNGYKGPREDEAAAAMQRAEHAFEAGNYKVALDGNGADAGFLSIMDDYSGTKASNAAKLYAGLSYKEMGDAQKALDYLNDYDADGDVVEPSVYVAIGDCNWDLNDEDNAIKAYQKAVDKKSSTVSPIALKRMGIIYLKKNDVENANKAFQTIKDEYSDTDVAKDIDKFIQQ